MNKNFTIIFGILTVSALTFFGCATKSNLDSAGPYASDPYLYNIDKTIITSFDSVDAFLKVEVQNNDYFKTNLTSVFNFANTLRDKVPVYLKDVSIARAYYVKLLGNTNESLATIQSAQLDLTTKVSELSSASSESQLNVSTTPFSSQFTNNLSLTPNNISLIINTNL